jgi:hypothetical protein
MNNTRATGKSANSPGCGSGPSEAGAPCCCHEGSAPEPHTLREVLERVGQELARVAERLAQFETSVGPRLSEAAGRDLELVTGLQSLDEIGQRVTGLVAFLGALAPSADGRCSLDPGPAAGIVTLADMAARLAFRDQDAATIPADLGDYEMF